MLGFLSHDMRQPQASILALLERGHGHVSAADSARISAHARRTLALADNFVQIARAESADQRHELIDLRDIMTDAADQLWDRAEARHSRILLHLPDDEVLLNGNPGLLARAFGNLIDNAIKYGPDHGRVDLSLTVADGQAVASVSDQGEGIPTDRIGHLFERFERAGRQDGDGTGLGLVLVRTVAEAHGGTVAYAEAPDGGACFTLSLPLAPVEP